jgi:uncharacterized protein
MPDRPPTDWVKDRPGGVLIRVRVKPRASKNQIEAVTPDGLLSVRLTAPPVEGAANAALTELIAKTLRVPKSAVIVVSGEKSRTKTVSVDGVGAKEVQAKLSF